MEKLVKTFQKVAKRINLDMKPAEMVMAQVMDCIGLHFDVTSEMVAEHFVTLDKESKDRLAHMESTLKDTLTPRRWMEI